MHHATLEILACPSCRSGFDAKAHHEAAGGIELGYLHCSGCGVVIPIVKGLALFTEPLLHPGQASEAALMARQEEWFGKPEDFSAYHREKSQRGSLEPYAAFQPFNESTRALDPLLPYVRPCLKSGDFILDTWCRTGWSGEWLAGNFPGNRVVSLWEGNNSVLAYRGFGHWLSSERRAANLDVILTHPERPLPFKDASFGFLYALDSLHRYSLYPFAGECLRVTKAASPIVFAHIHLNDSMPEPFFERGCRQFHSSDYHAWLHHITRHGERQAWLLDEAGLFAGPSPALLRESPEAPHYNALACLLPADAQLGDSPEQPVEAGERYVLNPLFRLNLSRRNARVAATQHDGMVDHLLQRHPVYRRRLAAAAVALNDVELTLMFLAVLGYSRGEIKNRLRAYDEHLTQSLDRLCHAEILLRAPISKAAHDLQRFHCNQLPLEGEASQRFWTQLTNSEGPILILKDGSTLGAGDLKQLSASLAASLPRLNWQTGDWISVDIAEHPLLLIVAVLACSQGINVRLLSDSRPTDSVCHLHGDASKASADMQNGLCLGLDGAEHSLLHLLSLHEGEVPCQSARATGGHPASMDAWIELESDGHCLRLVLSEWIEALASFHHQIDQQMVVFEGKKPLHDFLNLIQAILSGVAMREL